MSRNYSDNPWAEDDEYSPRSRSSRSSSSDRGGPNYNTYGDSRRPSNYGGYGGGRPPSHPSRPSRPTQGGYQSWMDDPSEYGRTRQAPPARGRQGPRAQPSRYGEQDHDDEDDDDDDSDEHDDPSMRWSCMTGRHGAVDDHVIGRYGEHEAWFDSRCAAEAALQCAVQCAGYPRGSCQVRQATHPEADPCTWVLRFSAGMAQGERAMGGEGRRGEERYGGDGRRGGGRRGGGRPSGGGGGGGYWYS